MAGSSRGVGIVGYRLGGGIGWFASSHGLAASSVTAIEPVTAIGVFRRVDQGEAGVVGATDAVPYPNNSN